MPKVSLVMITARMDYPYLGRPDLHVFEPTLEALKHQTMTDFEWIIVDVLYEERKDYFLHRDLPFQVKHIPAQPNLWLKRQMPGICAQYNKGIIYADGDILFFWGDSHMFSPNFVENLWERYCEGYFPLAWYFFDNTFRDAEPFKGDKAWKFRGTAKEEFKIAYPLSDTEAPVTYNMLGYTGKNVSIEHRYAVAFKDNANDRYSAPWEWWFGCSSASLEAMLRINGFDQRFDGDVMLLDCDVGSRLELAGYGSRFALFRDIYLIRCATEVGKWTPKVEKNRITIKCNYPLIWISRYFNKYRANTTKITDQDIEWIKQVFCPKCWLNKLCKREHPWQYPFEHKPRPKHPPSSKSSKRWFNFWKNHQEIRNLTEERELRLKGDKKYAVGTFL